MERKHEEARWGKKHFFSEAFSSFYEIGTSKSSSHIFEHLSDFGTVYMENKIRPKMDQIKSPPKGQIKPLQSASVHGQKTGLGVQTRVWVVTDTTKSQCPYLWKGHDNPTWIAVRGAVGRYNGQKNYIKNCFVTTHSLPNHSHWDVGNLPEHADLGLQCLNCLLAKPPASPKRIFFFSSKETQAKVLCQAQGWGTTQSLAVQNHLRFLSYFP